MTARLPDTLAILEWNRVVERLARYAETEMGRLACLGLTPRPDRGWLQDEQAAVREFLVWVEAGLPGASGASPLDELVERVEKGGVLSTQEFVQVRRTLEVYRVLGDVADPERFPLVTGRMRGQILPLSLMQAIDQAIDADGQVRDSASPVLADIRRRMKQLEREIDDVFERVLRSGEWSKYLQDGLVTVRFGRRVVPVRNEFRHAVAGIVHDQSGSGQTVFVEPMAVVERQNRLTTLRQDEAREIERILAALTAQVAGVQESVLAIHRHLAWFDIHVAVARYGSASDGVVPDIGGDRLMLADARHPLLHEPVPISLELSLDRPAIIITGPNTGGKTVALKTTGLITLMALAGLMVPAGPGTRIPLYRAVWADIGDEQSLEQSLSTFSSHLVRLAPMMTEADSRTLCLIDEIGAGTDPEEGAALAEVMVRHLVGRRAPLVASTHYSRLKLLGLNDPRIQNALVEFNRETLSPTYHLVLGSPGSSHAFYIARRLGFPGALVDQAEGLLDRDAVKLSDAILEINQLQQKLRLDEETMRDQKAQLEIVERRLQDKERQLNERLERDREKAEKAWHRELDEMREKFNQALDAVKNQEGRERARAVEALREQYKGLAKVPKHLQRAQVAGTPPEEVGDRVRVHGFQDIGTVIELEGRTATVQIGALRMKLAYDELERVPESNRPQPSPGRSRGRHRDLSREKSQNMGLEIDLRGMTQEEALEAVDKYLDDEVLAGAPFVRIIHGKGTGVLRRAVSQHLKTDPRVVRYRLGGAGEGGDGVTVAALEDTD